LNYLAHIFLSGDNELLKIGNFMGDSVHGKKYLLLDETLQKGILLHRAIDTFTDAHPIFRTSKHRLHQNYGHYSGIIIDIFYDYFLSKNWKNFNKLDINNYISEFYKSLKDNFILLNEKTQNIVPYMISQNWLASYSSKDGIELTLKRMDYRLKNQSNMQKAITELNEFESEFESEFLDFFNELIIFVENYKKNL
jgi:acyl carrier protein phosphodiesterase